MKKYSSMSQILDSPIEEVAEELEKLAYGELTSFKKMIEMQYQELEFTKNELMKLEDKEEIEKAEEVIKGLYKLMQKAEDVATVTEELKKQKEVKI